MLRVFVDFNSRDLDGATLLNLAAGPNKELPERDLREGLHVVLFDDEVEVEAVLKKRELWWVGRMVPGTMVDAPKRETL